MTITEPHQQAQEPVAAGIRSDLQVAFYRGADALQAAEDDHAADELLRRWSREQP